MSFIQKLQKKEHDFVQSREHKHHNFNHKENQFKKKERKNQQQIFVHVKWISPTIISICFVMYWALTSLNEGEALLQIATQGGDTFKIES